jgi:hypothetical protein
MPEFVVDSGWVEDADETEQIVVVLETRVDALEQEVAQMRVEGREVHQAQIRVLNSLRMTQIEHGNAIGEIQGTLKEHGETLKEHGNAIGEIQGTLKEHGRLLHEVGLGMAGITRSLDYLISQQGQPQS